MLLLQLKKLPHRLPKRYIFLCQLIGVATAIHASLLSILFFGTMSQQSLIIDTTLVANDAPIVVVPWCKTIARTPSPQQRLTTQRTPLAQNNSVAKNSTTIVQAAPAAQKKEPAKKQEPPKKQGLKSSLEKKESTKADAAKKLPMPPPTKEKPVQQTQATASNHAPIAHNESDPIYIGRDEVDLLQLTQEVTSGIAEHWQRPAGLTSTASCRIKLFISNEGKKEVLIEQSSGALVYDMSAKQAILRYDFPKSTWNRQLVLIM